jgi:Holliday junction DNA helicase RuvA
MIDYLKGTVAHIESEYIVLDVHDVGYRIFCPNPYAFQSKAEELQTVYIYHHVREDAILLFGFQTREEQTLFRRLLDVSGIGPRVAVGILSGSRPESIIAAIQQENLNFLIKLPGIGKKTAQRMVLDLKDKLDAIAPLSGQATGLNGTYMDGNMESGGSVWSEAKQGLMSLGYTEAEANRSWLAIKSKVQDSDSVDVVMKLALQALYKG